MARKPSRRKKSGKAKRRTSGKARPAKRLAKLRTPDATVQLVNAGLHDFTNLATAVKAYLELLASQGSLEAKQKYYVDRAREQVEMMVDLVRELKEKVA